MVTKIKNLVFIIFQVVFLDFENFNNDKKFTVKSFILKFSLKSILLALKSKKFDFKPWIFNNLDVF